MSGRSKVLVAVLAGAAVVVPATLVLAGNGDFAASDTSRQTISWSGSQSTNNKQWKPVPGVANPVVSPDPQSFAVSAQMKKGAAKFRIVRIGDGVVRPPGAVKFSAEGANSFTFATVDTCGQGEQHELQWKRSGPGKAVAAKLSTHAVWDGLCL